MKTALVRIRKHNRAFTLIELLIVVAIIGILAAIAVPNFLNARYRAQIARNQADMQATGTALEQYRLDNNGYPPVSNCGLAPAPRHSEGWALCLLTSPIAYMGSLPQDPFNPGGVIGDEAGVNDFGYYWYMDRRTRSSGSCDKASGDRFFVNESQLWSIKSPGPDKDEDTNPGVTGMGFVVVLYDISNGLISDGDIYRWGP